MRYLVYEFNYKPKEAISFVLDLMCVQASKLWNEANYERIEYQKVGFDKMPSLSFNE